MENGGLGPDLVENGGEVRAVHRLQLEFLAPLNHRGDHPAGQNLRRLDHRLCVCVCVTRVRGSARARACGRAGNGCIAGGCDGDCVCMGVCGSVCVRAHSFVHVCQCTITPYAWSVSSGQILWSNNGQKVVKVRGCTLVCALKHPHVEREQWSKAGRRLVKGSGQTVVSPIRIATPPGH